MIQDGTKRRHVRVQNAHANTIDLLLRQYPGARRSGFSKALNAIEFLDVSRALEDEEHEELEEEAGEPLPPLSFANREEYGVGGPARVVPDAFLVDFETQSIFAFEVEHSFGVSEEKLERYFDPWFRLDCIYWELIVIGVNRWGGAALINVTLPTPPDPLDTETAVAFEDRLDTFENYSVPYYRFARLHTELDIAERERNRAAFLTLHPNFRANDYWLRADVQKKFRTILQADRK